MKKKKVKFTTKEILVCPHCYEEVEQCEQCCEELCIELGCEFDGYCIDRKHFCQDCGRDKK